ncbi:hypothetical protein PDTK01_07810 [Phycicoccus sp. DTK01]|nr:hypothetical protein PDTK01_07810 [Phycicoccus sp. DTK01]
MKARVIVSTGFSPVRTTWTTALRTVRPVTSRRSSWGEADDENAASRTSPATGRPAGGGAGAGGGARGLDTPVEGEQLDGAGEALGLRVARDAVRDEVQVAAAGGEGVRRDDEPGRGGGLRRGREAEGAEGAEPEGSDEGAAAGAERGVGHPCLLGAGTGASGALGGRRHGTGPVIPRRAAH